VSNDVEFLPKVYRDEAANRSIFRHELANSSRTSIGAPTPMWTSARRLLPFSLHFMVVGVEVEW
jgi:hypothetical protein